jgi:drug/metabolite transporter (DMT)-like permease
LLKFLRTHGALLIVNFLYAANYSIAKQIMPLYIKPFGMIVLRVTTAVFVYCTIEFLFIKTKIDFKKDWKRFALCGFFGIAFNQLCFFKGLSLTTPINGSLLMIVTPIFVIGMSAYLAKNRITKYQIIGTILGASGAFLLIGGDRFKFSSDTAVGDLFIIINAMSYAIYLVLVKPLMNKYNPFSVITYVFLFGYGWVLMVGTPQVLEIDWQAIPTHFYWHLAFILIGVTVVVYYLNLLAMKEMSSEVVGNYIYTQPVFTVCIALFLGMDHLSGFKICCGLIIALGVYLVSRK